MNGKTFLAMLAVAVFAGAGLSAPSALGEEQYLVVASGNDDFYGAGRVNALRAVLQ